MRKESVQMSAKTGAEGLFDVVREIFDVAKKNGQTDVFEAILREKSRSKHPKDDAAKRGKGSEED